MPTAHVPCLIVPTTNKSVWNRDLLNTRRSALQAVIVVRHSEMALTAKRRPVTAEGIEDPAEYDSDWCQSFSPTEAAYQVPCSPHHYFEQLPSSQTQSTQSNKNSLPSPPTSPRLRRKRTCAPINIVTSSHSLSPLRLGSIDEDPEYDFGFSLDLGSESPASASTPDLVSSSDVLREWAGAGIAVPRVPARRRSWRSSSFSRDRIKKVVVNEADRDCAICFEYAWLNGPNGTGRCPHCELPCSLENNTISLASPTDKKRKQPPSPLLLIRSMSNETIPCDSTTDNEASGSTSRGRSRAARHQDPTRPMEEEEASGSGRRRDSPSPVPYASTSPPPFLAESAKDSSRYSIPTPPNSSAPLSRDSFASESSFHLSSDPSVSPSTVQEKGKPHYSIYLTTGALSASPIGPTTTMSSSTASPASTASSSQTSIDTLPSPGPGAEMQGPLSHLATVVAFVYLLYTLMS
ncbi:uncharacterized protein LACBIDRAFT_331293 [Laccaria bicolor S238N-H82]|uniref:Predicted protein n=1 Tax=Laccaria bicolor (strain S238N-H82 / ATCC MYA-4686) TaxID=486041 RepID=B0DP19_LACBS|nr:uncharacterized protein LACBIDRAFT_331293 [Laccaria bicolor S238N-H82]EDR03533.1 predicted protein [Laccaria bicolor S238N-H82]|eukprot:XP_001885681.1 predicted protein [Laccaria bicolor S238N-H82]